jgi:AraC-like DNA-binding protein
MRWELDILPDDVTYVPTRLRRTITVRDMYSFHYYEFSSAYFGIEEAHDFWEMVYADSGSILCTAEDRSVRLSQGQAILHPPNRRHNIHALSIDGSACVFSFSCKELDPEMFFAKALNMDAEQRCLIGSIYQEGRALFRPPYNVLRQSKPEKAEGPFPFGIEQLIKNMIENLLLLIVRDQLLGADCEKPGYRFEQVVVRRRNHDNEKFITEKVIQLMRENVNGKLSIREICQSTAFSESHIHNVFKKQTGLSVMHYFNKLKIDRAKQLIGDRRHNFTQISSMLGFSSVHHFSHAFRSFVHMSPTEYERSVKMQALL